MWVYLRFLYECFGGIGNVMNVKDTVFRDLVKFLIFLTDAQIIIIII